MRILILGSTAWVAHYLIKELVTNYKYVSVKGISRRSVSLADVSNIAIENCSFGSIEQEINNFRPTVFVNCSRSESFEDDYKLHVFLCDLLNRNKVTYFYFSSSTVFDGYEVMPFLDEQTPVCARSNYGLFKVKCEQELVNTTNDFCIIRFTAVHGWAPNRIARTESFLKRLQCGESILVNRGFFQNRAYVGHLAKMVASLICGQSRGIYHLGTTTGSEEFEFLRAIAMAFGYNPTRIIEGENKNINFTMFPNKLVSELSNSLAFTEQDTINELRQCSRLSEYRVLGEILS